MDLCIIPGCKSRVRAGGLCIRHGGNGRCAAEGCDRNVRSGGRCYRHRAKSWCTFEGCANEAVGKGGACSAHKWGVCAEAGCDRPSSSARGRCYRHRTTPRPCRWRECQAEVVGEVLCRAHLKMAVRQYKDARKVRKARKRSR